MKKVLSIILAAVLLLGVMPVVSFATEIVASGTCGANGNNLTWTLDDEGTLIISGTGEMRDYSLDGSPWYYNRNIIRTIIEDGVTSIGNNAFYFCINMLSVAIPDGVISFGDRAFAHCESLTNIPIPNSVTTIGKEAISYCESLTSVTIPNSVTVIGLDAFYWCKSLTRVYAADIVSWCKIAFSNEYSNPLRYASHLYLNETLLEDLTIPESLTTVKAYSFVNCNDLTSVMIPNSVTRISSGAFRYCENLKNVTIPNSVTFIGDSVFYPVNQLHILCYKDTTAHSFSETNGVAYGLLNGTEEENTFSGSVGRLNWSIDRLNCVFTIDCIGAMPSFSVGSSFDHSDSPWSTLKSYIRQVVLTDGVTSISSYAFYYCNYLTSVTIPDSVKNIGDYSFNNCTSLKSITIPDGVTTIGGYAFLQCTSLTSLTIPSSVTSIGYSAFARCTALNSVITPYCGAQDTFSYCTGLKSVTIENRETEIRSGVFYGCTGMKSIEIPSNTKRIWHNAFAGCTALESIYFYNPNCTIEAGATPANATVYGYSASTAETYADENGLLFMEIDGHEHHFTVTKTVEPTCTEDGYQNMSCPCGERKTETLLSGGHTEVIVPAKDATCTEAGYEAWSYCEVCGEPLTEKAETQPNGHTPLTTGAYAATCSKNGFTGVTYCSVCKEVLNAGETILATGAHTPDEAVETVLKAASCGKDGMKLITVKCSVCGETLSTVNEIIPATNAHTAGEAEETILLEASCGQKGIELATVKCAVCGDTLSETAEEIPALGHTDEDGNGQCDRCNASLQVETPPQPEQPQPSGSSEKHWYDWIVNFFKMFMNLFKF